MSLNIVKLRFFLQQIRDRCGMTKSRRSLFFLILIGTIIFYFLSKLVPRRVTHDNIELNVCLQSQLEEYSIDQRQMDVIINHRPIHYDETPSFPFTGNGHIALALSSDAELHLINDEKKTSFVPTNFSPLVRISLADSKEFSATIHHFRRAFVEQIQCFEFDEKISTLNRIFVHRTRPSLLIQQINLINPTDKTIEFDLRRSSGKSSNEKTLKIDENKENFLVQNFQIGSIRLVVIQNEISSKISVKPNERFEKTLFNIVKFSSEINSTELERRAKDDLIEILRLSSNTLIEEHRTSWASIWRSFFSISRSYAPSTINGDAINRTIYFLLSSSPLSIRQSKTNESLFHFDRCYESHSTLLGERLWRSPGDVLAVAQLTNLWRTTLEKRGCSMLMRDNLDAFLQSILFSIGAIRYRNHHLEMHLDPKELHRDLFFYRISFGSNSFLNISIQVENDNRPAISISIDQNQSHAYACDAGCIDPPTKLSREPIRLPVKMTNPPTAILYVTEDFESMTQLKDTLHVKHVEIAPPHAHNLLALHRHGHQLGGLPIVFWLILAFLIVIFHLFLLKIILNEMGFVKSSFVASSSRTRIH